MCGWGKAGTLEPFLRKFFERDNTEFHSDNANFLNVDIR